MLFRKHDVSAHERDHGLRDLLSAWNAPDPRSTFDASVWRRIRSEAASKNVAVWQSLLEWVRPHPVWAAAVTASVAFFVGAAVALTLSVQHRDDSEGHHALLRPGTVAGTYLALADGRRP